MSYDTKCFDLATAFGEDTELTEWEIDTLAQTIQDAIEEKITSLIKERAGQP